MSTLGKRIKSLRTSRGLSQRELARLVNMDQSFLSRVENGMNTPTVEHIPVIARHLGVTPGYLLGQGEGLAGLTPELRKLLAKDGPLPGGLIELAQHKELMNALQITEREFRTLASVDLPPDVDRDGYVQLLMTIRAIARG